MESEGPARRFFINGRLFNVRGGSSISIINGKVLVGGRPIDDLKPVEGQYKIVVENGGTIESLETDCDVTVSGDVQGSVSAGSSVSCRNVGGAVSAGSSVHCDKVAHNVSAGSSVTCGDVGGSVSGSSVYRR